MWLIYVFAVLVIVFTIWSFLKPLFKREFSSNPTSEESQQIEKTFNKPTLLHDSDHNKTISDLADKNSEKDQKIKELEISLKLLDREVTQLEDKNAEREWNEQGREDKLVERITKIVRKDSDKGK